MTQLRIPKSRKSYLVPKLNKWEWAYIAGIVDGEGWIGFAHEKKDNYYRPCIVISNTNKEVIDWINLKTNNPEKFVRVEQTKYKGKICKPIYRSWFRTREAVVKILEHLLPFLIIKKDKAKDMIKKLMAS